MSCANACVEILARSFPNAPWLTQVHDMVELAVDRAVRQLATGQQAPAREQELNGAYYARARTAEEIRAEIASEEGAVSAAPREHSSVQRANAGIIDDGELADPAAQLSGNRPAPPSPPAKEWLL